MKQNFLRSILLISIIISFSSRLYSQNDKSEKIGKNEEFISQLRKTALENSQKDQKLQKGRKSDFKLDKAGNISAKVRHYSTINETEIYSGKLENAENSNVIIEVKGGKVEGTIVNYDEKKSFKYKSDDNGDLYLEEVDINSVVCVELQKVNSEKSSASTSNSSTSSNGANVYGLHTNWYAPTTIYLDFDGEYVDSPCWGIIDAQPSGLGADDIYTIWSIVAEDFAPFNVNVTTDRSYYDSQPAGTKHMNIFTTTTTAAPGWGGVAMIGSFTSTAFCPSWSFNLGAKVGGETASHEVGHTLGLNHDGRTNPQETYFAGHNTWGPIMGATFSKDIVHWSKGEYQYASNTYEDDFAIITQPKNKMGYKADEIGNTISNAYPISYNGITNGVGNVNITGMISKQTDVDVYRFTTNGGNISLSINPAAAYYGYAIGNLDIKAELLNSSGGVIATSNPAGLGAILNQNLAAGTYYFRIDGVGAGDPLTDGYSDYGSVGTYLVTGTIASPAMNQFHANISYPENGQVIVNPTVIRIKPQLFSMFSPVTMVEYFEGNVKLGHSSAYKEEHYLDVSTFSEGQHTIYIKATNGSGQVVTSASITFTVYKNLTPELSGNFYYGLTYDYYEGSYTALPNFGTLTPLSRGIANNVGLTGLPVRADNFAVRYTGHILISDESLYRFTLNSDDGSKLYVGNRLIINNDGTHGMRELEGFVALAPGYYPITVEYFEATGGQDLILNIYDAYTKYNVYPSFYHKDINPNQAVYLNYSLLPGVKYEYHEGTYDALPANFNSLYYKSTGVLTNYSLSIPGRRTDYFAVRFSGYIDVNYTGEYKFFTKSDDGTKLYVDDQLIVNNDGLHDMSIEKSGSIWLTGGKHKIRIEYFEKTGGEGITVSYSGPGVYKMTIPNNVLTREVINGEQVAYPSYEITVPGYLYAENYDHGGQGVAYNDNTPGNQFNLFRNDGVDIQEYLSYRYTNYWISNIQDGEWVEYTVRATKSGYMNITLGCTSGNGTSKLHIERNNIAITPVVNVPVITDGSATQDIAINNIYFPQGVQVLKVFFDKGGFMFDYMSIYDVPSRQDLVGGPENVTTKNVIAFPNPFDQVVNFDLTSFDKVNQIKVINMNGVTMWQSTSNDQLSGLFSFQKELPSGMYVVEINADDELHHTTLIRQ